MDLTRGFSLIEVIIALFLLTGMSLTLLKQQWQFSQIFNHLLMQNKALLLLDNASETILANSQSLIEDKRFSLYKIKNNAHLLTLQIHWEIPASSSTHQMIERQLWNFSQ